MKNSERLEQLFRDIADAPTGPVNEDFTPVTVKDQFTDTFIRTLAGHLLSLGYVRQEETDSSADEAQEQLEHIKCPATCATCAFGRNGEGCWSRTCRECAQHNRPECYRDCACDCIEEGKVCRYYRQRPYIKY